MNDALLSSALVVLRDAGRPLSPAEVAKKVAVTPKLKAPDAARLLAQLAAEGRAFPVGIAKSPLYALTDPLPAHQSALRSLLTEPRTADEAAKLLAHSSAVGPTPAAVARLFTGEVAAGRLFEHPPVGRGKKAAPRFGVTPPRSPAEVAAELVRLQVRAFRDAGRLLFSTKELAAACGLKANEPHFKAAIAGLATIGKGATQRLYDPADFPAVSVSHLLIEMLPAGKSAKSLSMTELADRCPPQHRESFLVALQQAIANRSLPPGVAVEVRLARGSGPAISVPTPLPVPAPSEGLDGRILVATKELKASNPTGRPRLPQVYERVGGGPGGLTLGQFHDALRRLAEAGRIRLYPFTGPLGTLEDPRNALYHARQVAFYIDEA